MTDSVAMRGSLLLQLVCLLGALLRPVSAAANIVGPLFSGPTAADPMVVYWNPAAMTLLRGTSALLFGGVTAISVDYDRSTPSAYDGGLYPTAELRVPRPELGFGAVTDATLSRLRFGIGVAIPILDGATWEPSYGGVPSAGRHFAIDGRQVHLVVRPAVALEVARYLSLGVGLDIHPVNLRQTLMIDFGAKVNQLACAVNQTECLLDAPLAREDPALDGLSVIAGSTVALGASAGILVSPTRWLRLGVSVHSGAGDVRVPVSLSVELPDKVADFLRDSLPSVPVPELEAAGEVVLSVAPLTFIAGVTVIPIERLELEALFHWSRKSRLSVLIGDVQESSSKLIADQVLIRSFLDDWHLGLRAAYRLLPRLRVGLRVEVDPGARTERMFSPISLDFDRLQIELGAAWRALDWLTVYAEYAHFFFVPVQVERSAFAPNAHPTTPEEAGLDRPQPLGRYHGQANRVATGLLFAF